MGISKSKCLVKQKRATILLQKTNKNFSDNPACEKTQVVVKQITGQMLCTVFERRRGHGLRLFKQLVSLMPEQLCLADKGCQANPSSHCGKTPTKATASSSFFGTKSALNVARSTSIRFLGLKYYFEPSVFHRIIGSSLD